MYLYLTDPGETKRAMLGNEMDEMNQNDATQVPSWSRTSSWMAAGTIQMAHISN